MAIYRNAFLKKDVWYSKQWVLRILCSGDRAPSTTFSNWLSLLCVTLTLFLHVWAFFAPGSLNLLLLWRGCWPVGKSEVHNSSSRMKRFACKLQRPVVGNSSTRKMQVFAVFWIEMILRARTRTHTRARSQTRWILIRIRARLETFSNVPSFLFSEHWWSFPQV